MASGIILTPNVIKLMLLTYDNKNKITSKTQTLFNSAIQFYMLISYLKNQGIFITKKKNSREKEYFLTSKGIKIAEKLSDIRELLNDR